MGNSYSDTYGPRPLVLVSPPVGVIGSQYIAQQPTILYLRELISLSGEEFKIKDSNGTVLFRCHGHFFSGLSQKKTVMDMFGNPVFNIKHKVLSFTKAYELYLGDNSQKLLGDIDTHITMTCSKMTALLTTLGGTACQFIVKGDFRVHEAFIFRGDPKRGGTLLAKVFRPVTARQIFLDKHDYCLEIAPGVDMALMVSLCIMMDESYKD
ncbi:hypothetical protein K7432_000674 [Basidiobolus ranarum]|uniref:Phospholipid scramblase n=1 Tax=Basidiobolus ranarum TaxID=34480 RepID=A0ABR2WAT3_9FUNG